MVDGRMLLLLLLLRILYSDVSAAACIMRFYLSLSLLPQRRKKTSKTVRSSAGGTPVGSCLPLREKREDRSIDRLVFGYDSPLLLPLSSS